MNVRLRWQGGVCFDGECESGHCLRFDGAPEVGGQNLGARPMEGVLAAAAACSAADVARILKKAKQSPATMSVTISGDRAADSSPKVFTAIHLHFSVGGENLRDATVARAVQLSVEKYCSVLAMLEKTAAVTHSHNIHRPQPHGD